LRALIFSNDMTKFICPERGGENIKQEATLLLDPTDIDNSLRHALDDLYWCDFYWCEDYDKEVKAIEIEDD